MEKMYLISKEELLDLLIAWHRMNCLEKWCRENKIPYEEDFSFEDIAKHELESYEETELAWT